MYFSKNERRRERYASVLPQSRQRYSLANIGWNPDFLELSTEVAEKILLSCEMTQARNVWPVPHL